jgi:hypothetical protein
MDRKTLEEGMKTIMEDHGTDGKLIIVVDTDEMNHEAVTLSDIIDALWKLWGGH